MNKLEINILPQSFETLPINLHTFCTEYKQDYLNAPYGRAFYQILFVVGGEGIVSCRGQVFNLKKGCAFFTAPNIPITYHSTDSLYTAFLTVTGEGVRALEKYYECDGFLFRQSVKTEKFLSVLNDISEEFHSHRRNAVLSSLSYSFFVDFFENVKYEYNIIRDVASYIERNFAKKITLEKLSAKFGISVSKLSHNFKKEYNHTVFEYILDLRLNYARTLITFDKECRIKDASLACGFEDTSYFCKAYKNKFGCTPSEDKNPTIRKSVT